MNVDVLIVGGGLAGLSTAHHLGLRGVKSRLLIEAKDSVGGTAGSVTHHGFTFDYTGHLLHLHDPYGQRLILELLNDNIVAHQRKAWIYSMGVLTRYPYQANTNGLPQKVVVDNVAGFLETVHRPVLLNKNPDFLSWSRATFGEGITRHFLRPYNEKLWRIPLARMTTEWQGRFVPKPTAAEVVSGAFLSQSSTLGYNATFRYPARGGIQALPDALAARLEPGVIRTGCSLEAIDLRERVARVKGLGEVKFQRVVNTIPLPHFLDCVTSVPKSVAAARKRLRWNTVWNLNLGVSRPAPNDQHWIYFPEKRYPFYRVGYASNFSAHVAPEGHSSLYVEVSRRGGERVDVPRLENAVLKGLREVDILRKGDVLSAKLWMPINVGYVVYDQERTPAVKTIFNYFGRSGVDSIGRYGGWKYSFMEEAILDGKKCAERLTGAAVGGESSAETAMEPLK